MKASDLRIGNLIDRGDYICKVIRIEESGILTEPLNYEGERLVQKEIKPIPLTEEILLKCGFENDSTDEGIKVGVSLFRQTSIRKGVNLPIDIIFRSNSKLIALGYFTKLNHIKYVHQLQNLYWCLVGEELNIQL